MSSSPLVVESLLPASGGGGRLTLVDGIGGGGISTVLESVGLLAGNVGGIAGRPGGIVELLLVGNSGGRMTTGNNGGMVVESSIVGASVGENVGTIVVSTNGCCVWLFEIDDAALLDIINK